MMNHCENGPTESWVLQLCHGYDGPFLDCARQYSVLFRGTSYKVCTVYLTGEASKDVEQGSASDEVVFLGYSSRQVRGLKLEAIREIRRITAKHDFVLCIAHRFKPTYVALFGSRLPVIGISHAFGDYHRRTRKLLANVFTKRLTLLGVSNAVRDDLRKCLPRWTEERIQTLYNRIDINAVQTSQLSRDAARAHLGLQPGGWVVGNVGRLHPDKDQRTLIRGFAQALPHLPSGSLLVIMGSGPLDTTLKALVAESGLSESVRFLGQVPNGRRYFKAFDVFALTSDHEPFGMVLLEAMAAGVPLICSDCGGGREVVDGVGELFALGDVGDLARCLISASVEPGQCEAIYAERLQEVFSDEYARKRFHQLIWSG
jgi:glycosyltransferase involved in cell wall biosynthesis